MEKRKLLYLLHLLYPRNLLQWVYTNGNIRLPLIYGSWADTCLFCNVSYILSKLVKPYNAGYDNCWVATGLDSC